MSNFTTAFPPLFEDGHQSYTNAILNAPISAWCCVLLVAFASGLLVYNAGPSSTLPFVNHKKSHWTYSEGKAQFRKNAKSLIADGFRKFSGPFNIVTGTGPLIMLPPEYISAVNAEPNLNFNKFTEESNLAYLDTFRNFRAPPPRLFDDAVMQGLTRSLPKFTKPLSDEMSSCLKDTWAESAEWHAVDLKPDVLTMVARLSCRIFMGEELTHNKEWLRISIDYTVNIFTAVGVLKFFFPSYLQPIAEKFLPICRKVRADRRAAYKILEPVLKERKDRIAAAEREGKKPDVPNDSIEWFRTAAKGREYNDVDLQIGLSLAAIHTTSDLLTQALLNLGAHPEFLEPLRQEAVEVLSRYGWKKIALTELRLLDSFFKETQRIKPIGMSTMHRVATADVELPGGIKIRKGECCGISSHRMWDDSFYENPTEFDAFRFMKRRKIPGLENKSLLVATSEDHTAFSHGKHACPGRFFAANEVKIAMVHALLKYDVKLADPKDAQWSEFGQMMNANPNAKLLVRRRKEEINLDDLSVE